MDFKAFEQDDKLAKNKQAFQIEYHGYTPLMLAIASPYSNLETVKALVKAKSDFKRNDEFGNSLLQIAAINSNNEILEFLTKTLKFNIHARNSKGETAWTICKDTKN